MEQSARLPPHGAVTGWAALRLAGANFFDGLGVDGHARIPVLLAVGADSKVRADGAASVSREPLNAEEVVVRHGVRCTRVERALFDEMRRVADWREAVVAMDMAAAADLVSTRQMQAYAAARSRWRRSRQVLRALAHASEISRSSNESRMRLVWVVDARLPARRELVVARILGAPSRAQFLPEGRRQWELRARPGPSLDDLLQEKAALRRFSESADAS